MTPNLRHQRQSTLFTVIVIGGKSGGHFFEAVDDVCGRVGTQGLKPSQEAKHAFSLFRRNPSIGIGDDCAPGDEGL